MKRNLLLIMLCYATLLFGQSELQPEIIKLDTYWSFAKSGSNDWLSATVPGTIHQDLLHHNLLPDPFYGTNEQKIQWVENEDWEYKTCFSLSEDQMKRQAARLVFEGLDTYADVYLNGARILAADNMFKGYAVEVKDMLRCGENHLRVVFRSPIKETLPQWETNGFEYPADNDHADKKVSIFSRKAPYSFGWDWGIRMATCGIWRPVTLQLYNVARIDDYYVKQLSLTDEKACLSNQVEIYNVTGETIPAEIDIDCSLSGATENAAKQQVTLQPGYNSVNIPLDIRNPKRWMPNGWGSPTLYDFTVRVSYQNEILAEKHHRIGLRTIRVVAEKDSAGESFYFEVNGIPMFAKGANYIPSDALLPNVTAERYQTLFRDVKEANMNMIRVWGGGIYENDYFYDLADENGILVWQDFMFACTPYPADPPFLKKVAEEAEYNIRRLRNHACLAMWCGNNEIEEGIKYWGWQKRFDADVYKRFGTDYRKLFHELLPAQVAKFDEGRFYMHTSPYFANWGRPESWSVRDSHNWGTWYGRKPFESADEERSRFVSEYGFQSFPEMKTIRTFASPSDYRIDSEVMTAHQKSTVGNDLIAESMERYFKVPQRFEDFVYIGLVLQGQGMRRSMEAHRRQRPYCMGTLYWQLNDSWPVVSWSSIDYYGNWKALHYQAKRAFAPVLISPLVKNDSLRVHLISDLLDNLQGLTLDMRLTDFSGKVWKKESRKVDLPANSSHEVFGSTTAYWKSAKDLTECYLLITLKNSKKQPIAQSVCYFVPTKDLKLPETKIRRKVKYSDGSYTITLSSPKLAKDVFIEIPVQGARFSDNFFDLLPGEKRVITIESPRFTGDEEIAVRHIRDTY